MEIIVIFIEGGVPIDSEIRTFEKWEYFHEPISKTDEAKSDSYIEYIEILNDFKSGPKRKYGWSPKLALKKLNEIQIKEQNKLIFNFHYSYFYENQCNIEFDVEFVKLLAKLKCRVSMICAPND